MPGEKKRIEYIDYLKGLTIMWVVWYHTAHPAAVGWGFRIPLFFFVSGIFFKIDLAHIYFKKKLNQLIVPFIFFTIIYYIFHLAQLYWVNGTLTRHDFSLVLDLFRPHTLSGSLIINPPLWFICALIGLQLTTWLLIRLFRQNRPLITVAVLAIWWWDLFYFYFTPNYFMYGRALRFLPYYAFGYIYGKDLLKIVETAGRRRFLPLVAIVAAAAVVNLLPDSITYIEVSQTLLSTFAIIIFLVYLFKAIYRAPVLKPLVYYGKNSYIVLGMHEIILYLFALLMRPLFPEMTYLGGAIQTILTLVALWPVIWFMNRFTPRLAGKKPLFRFKALEKKTYLPERKCQNKENE